jgi:hypothetical protein
VERQLDRSGVYSVRGVCQFLTSHQVLILDVDPELVWHKKVPLKVSVFAWRLLQNRLSTKDNLVMCGVLQVDDHFLHSNLW